MSPQVHVLWKPACAWVLSPGEQPPRFPSCSKCVCVPSYSIIFLSLHVIICSLCIHMLAAVVHSQAVDRDTNMPAWPASCAQAPHQFGGTHAYMHRCLAYSACCTYLVQLWNVQHQQLTSLRTQVDELWFLYRTRKCVQASLPWPAATETDSKSDCERHSDSGQ